MKRRGFSLIELLVAMVIVALLLSLLWPALRAVKREQAAVACLSNVRQVATALTIYAADYDDVLPTEDLVTWDVAIRPYLHGEPVLHCPGDISELSTAAADVPSYAWRSDDEVTVEGAGLTGDRVSRAPADLALVFDPVPGYHRDDLVGVARVDTAAAIRTYDELLADLDRVP